MPADTSLSFRALWGDSPQNYWAVGDQGLLRHWNGQKWETIESPADDYSAVGGSSSADVWLVQRQGTIDHWNGSTWQNDVLTGSVTLHGLSVLSPTSAWAAGDGRVYQWNGTAWKVSFDQLSGSMHAVCTAPTLGGGANHEIWAVGDSDAIYRRSGNGMWSGLPSPFAKRQLNGLWCDVGTELWMVGGGGAIGYWNGLQWSSVSSPTDVDLHAVWGSNRADVWAVGDGGTILHWTNFSWVKTSSGTQSALRTVWGTSANDVWAAGDNGTMLRLQ